MKTKRFDKLATRVLIVFFCIIMILTFFPDHCQASADGTGSGRKTMVSLGDSYSSGESITPFYGQENISGYPESIWLYTKVENEDWIAHRSTLSWPGRLKLSSLDKPMKNYIDTYWYFVATAGATTYHMENPFLKEYKKRVSGFGLNAQYAEGKVEIDPQFSIFEKSGPVDYVTMTLGGNDMGFVDLVRSAVTSSLILDPNYLTVRLNRSWKEFFRDEGIQDRLVETYKKIRDKAGDQAYILIAGYPKLLDPDGSAVLFSQNSAKQLNDAVHNFNLILNNMIEFGEVRGRIDTELLNDNIYFVSVEEEFETHGAYSDEPFITKVMLGSESEDRVDSMVEPSEYSMHPTNEGAGIYADCVQKKIKELEDAEEEQNNSYSSDALINNSEEQNQSHISDALINSSEEQNQSHVLDELENPEEERNIVLTLDVSGSMDGTPLEETQKASMKFIETITEEDANIGLVTYASHAMRNSEFTSNQASLESIVSNISALGQTNIEAGLSEAYSMLESNPSKKKIIVLMSDGEPNLGKEGDELIAYADEIKSSGVLIYTLGFFEDLAYNKSSAQQLMERIASDGCHYEVADADDLVFFFNDIADQINGQKYIYIRIACPVDVSVVHDGKILSSSESDLNTRTDFGTLTFEQEEDELANGIDDRVKILRLKEGIDYDLNIVGTGQGSMNYTIGFMDDQGDYSDLRRFEDIDITDETAIDTVVSVSDVSTLNIDQDGDGNYDLRLQAGVNGYGEEVAQNEIFYSIVGAITIICFLSITFLIIKH